MATIKFAILTVMSLLIIGNAAKLRDRNKLPYRVVCYYSFITAMRFEVSPEKLLNVKSCTHMIYAFAALENNELRPFVEHAYNQSGLYSYKNFNDHCRKSNPNITTLIAVGGWDNQMLQQNKNFSKMAKDPEARSHFIKSVVGFLQEFDFDGLSLDWAYPAHKGKWFSVEDKKNFVILLQELKSELAVHGFVLSCAAATGRGSDIWAYDILDIARTVDFVNLLTFDFHGPWETFTGANAPLYGKENETGEAQRLNIDYVIRHWVRQGMYPDKINFAIPAYSRCYSLDDVQNTGYGAPANNLLPPVHWKIRQPGVLAYSEFLEMWSHFYPKTWDADYQVFYALIDMGMGRIVWCSIEERQSIMHKIRYMRSFGLRNVMIWSIDLDLMTKQAVGEPLLDIYHYYKDLALEDLFVLTDSAVG